MAMGEKYVIPYAVSGAETQTIMQEQQGSISFHTTFKHPSFRKHPNHNPYNTVGLQK